MPMAGNRLPIPGRWIRTARKMEGRLADKILCFGELLLRLTAPGRELLLQSGRLDVHVGGAEANVAAALSACAREAPTTIHTQNESRSL